MPSTVTPTSTEATETETAPDVSVIIPVYNCEKYIEETIRSVREQDIGTGRFEIVAVNDGSTDHSLSILSSIAEEMSNLSIYSIPNSGSAAAPRNHGLDKSCGRYVFFLDADDKIEPETLRVLVRTADETGSGVVLCKLGPFGEAKRAGSLPTAAFAETRFAVDFVESNAVKTLGALKLFRRSILTENDVRFPLGFVIGEDQPFTMKAYLHSPHVSILADKVYYWARGRGDGTNVTSTGQSPRKHLARIVALTNTIVENTEPGELRDTLLKRPIAGSVGVPYVFGKKFVTSHNRREREEMLQEFRPLVSPLWTPGLRRTGIPNAQILTDLIVRNDLDEIEKVSNLLKNGRQIPMSFDPSSGSFSYLPSNGNPIKDLRVTPRTRLETISFGQTSLTVTGEVGVDGASEPPTAIRFSWKHRRLDAEVSHELDASRTYSRKAGTKTIFHASFDLDEFTEPSVWDATIEADWGTLNLQQHLGKLKSENIVEEPAYLGTPISAAIFYTKFGNLALDIGPVEKHLDVSQLEVPKAIGKFVVSKSVIIELRGRLRNYIEAEAHSQKSGRTTPIELVKHNNDSASVVVPRPVTRKGRYSIALIDADGNYTQIPLPN